MNALKDFEFYNESISNPIACSILVLADKLNPEYLMANFGHELALALKNVLEESTLKVNSENFYHLNQRRKQK